MKKFILLILILNSIIIADTRTYDQKLSEKNRPVTIYYNYYLKGAVKAEYTVDGNLVNVLNLRKRPSFRSNHDIPKKYRSYTNDYKHSGYDRGHLAPDADFDYNKTVLRSIYLMDNITPQLPNFNRKIWKYLEIYVRYQALKYKKLKITILPFYKNNPKRIGYHKIAVPYKFMKYIVYPKNSGKPDECYQIYNDNALIKNPNIKNYKILPFECSLTSLGIRKNSGKIQYYKGTLNDGY